jgi:steroid 5-alpha reductase family enzyme
VAFSWVYAAGAGFAAAPTIAALLITLWRLRLTFKFVRRGGFTTMEDYRWPILRARIGNAML